MNTFLLEETSCIGDLLPFTAIRSVLDIRMGILTFREKWTHLLGAEGFRLLEESNAPVTDIEGLRSLEETSMAPAPNSAALEPKAAALPANILPTRALAARIREEWERGSVPSGSMNRALTAASVDRQLTAGSADHLPTADSVHRQFTEASVDRQLTAGSADCADSVLTADSVDHLITHGRLIRYPWQLFQHNAEALIEDFALLTADRVSMPIPASVQTINPEAIFIEAGARLSHCLLNASTGPIYIARDAEIMEGSMIRGPFAACEGATVKMGTKIYGATTLGPGSTAGGEIKNVVFFGYSNKGHDGYLGDAVIGEWCNLGAGVSASNLKNTASKIRVYHPASDTYKDVGGKCGLLMGDYSRAAINTSFDTGTVVGVCCNVFGAGIPAKYIPAFSWGHGKTIRYQWDKVISDIDNWKKLKGQSITDREILTLKHIFEASL